MPDTQVATPLPAAAVHAYHAVAFVENIPIKELVPAYPDAKRTPHHLRFPRAGGGEIFIYPFGAVVFCDVPPRAREDELGKLRRARPELTSPTVLIEELAVREDPGVAPDVVDGVLTLDRLTPERSSIIALTIAQSAAMEYYERIVDEMFSKTDRLVERLDRKGTVSWRTRPLHKFIGAAVGTRSEVLSILHLLDKPDEAWDDPGIDRIYDELRAEFDLSDRYQSMEMKLRSMQEALELVLDVARDRRLVLLETSIVFLIVLEIVLSLVRH